MTALDDLQAVMFKWSERLSVIKPTLHRRNNHWYRLQFVEEMFDDSSHQTKKFNDCIVWTEEQLKNWSNCKRMAYDMWDFKHRKDAEKFITLFHLSWAQ